MRLKYFTITLFTLISVKYLVAQTPPGIPKPQIRAVVIGVSKYRDSLNFRNLKYAAKDAEDFATYLMNAMDMKVPANNIALLVNEKATRENIIDSIIAKFRPAQPNDELIFFFSGHGDPGSMNIGYLCPTDVRSSSIESTGIPMNSLEYLFNSRAKLKITYIDACHSGLSTRGNYDGSKSSVRTQNARLNNSILDYLEKSVGGNISMVSCQEQQESTEPDFLKNGYFTHFLLKGLYGDADRFIQGDEYGDGKITARELSGYLSRNVSDATGGRQTPTFKGGYLSSTIIGFTTKSTYISEPEAVTNFEKFNKLDVDTAHIYRGWTTTGDDHAKIDLKVPTDTVSPYLHIYFRFTDSLNAYKNVAYILIHITKHEKRKNSKNVIEDWSSYLLSRAYLPQADLNRFIVDNHLNEPNIEYEVGYVLKKDMKQKYPRYYRYNFFSKLQPIPKPGGK